MYVCISQRSVLFASGVPWFGVFWFFWLVGGFLVLPGSWGAVLLGWPALRAAMDTDRATTSPWNKIHEVASSLKGPNLRMSWYFVWFFSLSLALPTQGSLATTIVSGRAYLTEVPLPCDDTARFMASAVSTGLYLDTPGRARLTGLPTSGLNAVQQVN